MTTQAVVEMVRANDQGHPLQGFAGPYLQKALDEGSIRRWDLSDVFAQVHNNELDLWVLTADGKPFGAVVTAMQVYPKQKMIEVLLLGTDKHTDHLWSQCLHMLSRAGRELGACGIMGSGRPGWARKLGATKHISFELEIS